MALYNFHKMAVSALDENSYAVQQSFKSGLKGILRDSRNIQLSGSEAQSSASPQTIADELLDVICQLDKQGYSREAEALKLAFDRITDDEYHGGLGVGKDSHNPLKDLSEEALTLCNAWLESIASADNARSYNVPLDEAVTNANTRPMTLAQKIFAQHVIGKQPENGLKPGDVVRVGIDWVLASELSWSGMARTYEELGSPGIWRNDRFWLAGDHVVHPSIIKEPKIRAFVETAERAKRDFKMTEYQGMNYTIMHTEFVRERAQPGMVCVGSDSHTCSAGAIGCLSIGLGTADVMMALSLGETWFKIPESVMIEFVGTPGFAVSGKDVILHLLQRFKRNTIAADRIVEFSGEGLQHLSIDARFAIANMCTEFGAVTGVFVPDAITHAYVARRRRKIDKSDSNYFKPDIGAKYLQSYIVDLSEIEPTIAVYPKPDDVMPVSAMANLSLDGVFIGACTTTEEELVLAALVLKAGLEKKLALAPGKRHYVAGSLPIVDKLQKLGLTQIYEEAGFTRGPPGCSFCVGLSAEKAAEGETWLSSQNRNFENRMGKGSFGHITSAVVCAASAFSMMPTNPSDLLANIDRDFWRKYKAGQEGISPPLEYVEPDLEASLARANNATTGDATVEQPEATGTSDTKYIEDITSRIVQLPDFVDTDALAPGHTLTTCVTDEEFGRHVLEFTHPDFREKVESGQEVVVAGHAFGCGSSRECAVSALKGAGVKAVIARSFAFIYQRNQPSLGLLGFTMHDDEFFIAAKENEVIEIRVEAREIIVGGRNFPFEISDMECNLIANHGVAKSYLTYGKHIWKELTQAGASSKSKKVINVDLTDDRLAW